FAGAGREGAPHTEVGDRNRKRVRWHGRGAGTGWPVPRPLARMGLPAANGVGGDQVAEVHGHALAGSDGDPLALGVLAAVLLELGAEGVVVGAAGLEPWRVKGPRRRLRRYELAIDIQAGSLRQPHG